MSDRVEQMRTNRDAFDANVESIRNHPNLSADAKRRYLREAYDEAAASHKTLAEEHAAEQAAEIVGLEKEAFSAGIPRGVTSDPAGRAYATLTYRGAIGRADAAVSGAEEGKSPRALRDLMDKAERSGDEQRATACYHLARERGYHGEGDAYAAKLPRAKELWDGYTAARNAVESVEGRRFGAGGSVGALAPGKPREI